MMDRARFPFVSMSLAFRFAVVTSAALLSLTAGQTVRAERTATASKVPSAIMICAHESDLPAAHSSPTASDPQTGAVRGGDRDIFRVPPETETDNARAPRRSNDVVRLENSWPSPASSGAIDAGTAGRGYRSLLAQTAAEHIRYGFDLGQRGAVHSARAEFVRALHLVASGLDRAKDSQLHEEALTRALRAFRESDDFCDGQSALAGNVDVAAIASTHQTPVLHSPGLNSATSIDALSMYYEYGKENLVLAGGDEPVASQAVHGLARVEAAICNTDPAARGTKGPRAIALYQAAVLIDPTNHKAIAELGVMLARFGQLQQAQQALSHSLSLHPDPTTWDNFAVVCEKLGEQQMARDARQRAQVLAAEAQDRGGHAERGSQDPDRIVQWVDLDAFKVNAGPEPGLAEISSTAEQRPNPSQAAEQNRRSSWTNVFRNLLPGKNDRQSARTAAPTAHSPARRY